MKVLALDLGMTTGYAIGGGEEPQDDNEADALWLLDLVLTKGVQA